MSFVCLQNMVIPIIQAWAHTNDAPTSEFCDKWKKSEDKISEDSTFDDYLNLCPAIQTSLLMTWNMNMNSILWWKIKAVKNPTEPSVKTPTQQGIPQDIIQESDNKNDYFKGVLQNTSEFTTLEDTEHMPLQRARLHGIQNFFTSYVENLSGKCQKFSGQLNTKMECCTNQLHNIKQDVQHLSIHCQAMLDKAHDDLEMMAKRVSIFHTTLEQRLDAPNVRVAATISHHQNHSQEYIHNHQNNFKETIDLEISEAMQQVLNAKVALVIQEHICYL